MADDHDEDTPTKPASSAADNTGARTRASVSWRGIVDEPVGGSTERKKRTVFSSIGHFISAIFVGIGLKRSRNDDGTPGSRHLGRLAAIVLIGGGVLLVTSMGHITKAGNVSVPVTLGSAGTQFGEGFHITAPWPITTTYDLSVQTQNYTMTAAKLPGSDDPVTVLGSDGGSGAVDATVLYRLDPNRGTDVLRDVGDDYRDKLIRPGARACIRLEFTKYPMVSAATDSWTAVSKGVTDCMRDKIEPVGVTLQDFQLREIKLSDDLQGSVNLKVSSQQRAESQKFELQTSEIQADIVRVNAQATSDAQQILACGSTVKTVNENGVATEKVVPNSNDGCQQPKIGDDVLKYSWIQALREIGKNGNLIVTDGGNTSVIVPTPGGSATPGASTPSTTAAPPAPTK